VKVIYEKALPNFSCRHFSKEDNYLLNVYELDVIWIGSGKIVLRVPAYSKDQVNDKY
jgi:hypothetical protein